MLLTGPPLAPPPHASLTELVLGLSTWERPWLTVHHGTQVRPLAGPELLHLARRWRAAARAAGLEPGDRALLLLPNDEHFVAAFFGVLLAGATPVPLAATSTRPGSGLGRLSAIVAAAGPRVVLTSPGVSHPWGLPTVRTPADQPDEGDHLAQPDDPAFIQFTSGSTGQPRGAVITHRAAVACTWSMGQAMGLGPDDVGLSWLPLYHDMGLVGALLSPLSFGFPLHLMRPGEFLLHPRRWLDRIASLRATVSAAPDFAFRLAARRVRTFEGDLSSWRVALDGAEPVHRSTLDGFRKAFGRQGLSPDTLRPAYGLAEGTLGVCIYDPTDPAPDLDWMGRRLPSVGRPLPGVALRLRRADGQDCAEGEEGEILVQGPGCMRGYFRDPEGTARTLRDGWLHTGDLGVASGGQLYVTGRLKDLVIHNGVKLHPYDIERVTEAVAGASPGGVAAFPRDGGKDESLVVVVEVTARRAVDLEQRVRGALVAELGIRPDTVLAVAPGQLPRTTSGKIRRAEAARLFGGQHGR